MIIIVVLAVFGVVGLVLAFSLGGSEKYSREDIDNFAKCLTKSGTIMYGTFWCPHCAKTKKKFGESFRHINYVECDPNGENEQSELCLEKEIDKYDTWVFSDGSRFISEPSFKELSEGSGCPAPEVKNG